MTRRLLLLLLLYFTADFAVPLEPGPGRFVIEDMEDAVAAPRSTERLAARHAAATPATVRVTPRAGTQASRPSQNDDARRRWHTPPPFRVVAHADRPAPPDAH